MKNIIVLTLKINKKITERTSVIRRHTLVVRYVINACELNASKCKRKLLQINFKRNIPLHLLNARILQNELIWTKNRQWTGKFVIYILYNMYFYILTQKIKRAVSVSKRRLKSLRCILKYYCLYSQQSELKRSEVSNGNKKSFEQ